MKKIYILIVMLTQLFLVESLNAQCYSAINGLWPSATFTPTCTGAFQNITTNGYAGEYSNVNLVAGTAYTFRSSNTTDYITVDNNGAAPLVGVVGVSGTAGITWTCTVTGTYRFYTHTSAACGAASVSRTRSIRCAGAAYNPCATIPTLTCGAAATSYSMAASAGAWSAYGGPFTTPGQEKLFAFTPTVTGVHNVTVNASAGYVDLFWKAQSAGCNATGWTYVNDILGTETWGINLTAGVAYYIMLDDENTTANTGTIGIVCPVPATYDPCASIPTISGCGTSATANMTGAGAGWSVTSCGYATPGQERLFQFTAPTTGTYTLNVSAITGGYVDFFWKPASGGCNATGWNCIDDIFGAGTYNAIAPMIFTAGTTYYILLDPETTGTYSATFNMVCPVAGPANDLVCNAASITCGGTVSGTTVGAGNAGTGENQTCGTGQTMGGVWYVVPGNGQIMTASLCGTAWDSKISVFNGTNCSTLTCVGGNDDGGPACAGTSASYSWTSVVGQNYYILVHGYIANSAFSLNLSCVTPCPTPSNDLCANAPILNLGASNNQTHLGTGCGSTPNLGTYKDVFVAFTVPCGGMNVTIDFCGSTPVHNNAYLNIFPDCSFATFTGATTWDFTSCVDGNIKLYWNNVPAGTYYYPILIDPTWETNYVLNISGTPLYTPAVAPTSISGTTAVCSGQSTTLTLQGGSAGTNGVAQWFEGSCGSAVIGTGNSITVSPSANTTYFVRYAGSCNTTACASVSVTVNASTAPTLSGTSPVCPATSVVINATGGTASPGSTINWYTGPNGTGSFLGTGSSYTVTPSATSTYYARREGGCNTTSDGTYTITVNIPLGIAPTNGDMVWRGAATADWATLGNWWQYNGTAYTAASAAPTDLQNVIIPAAGTTCISNQPNTNANTGNAKSLLIENGATLTMGNGTLSIAENMVNNGTFTPGSGTVAFTGNGNHSISGSAATHAFNNLTMNKNGEVILNVPIIIAGSLTLTDGRLNIGNYNLDLPTNTINGGNVSSYVKTTGSGTLNRNVAGSPVIFPVGRSAYNAATLTNTGTADKFSIRVIDNVTDIGTNADAGATTTMAVVNRTWMISEQDAGGSIVTLGLKWNGTGEHSGGFQATSAFIAHYMSGAGLWDNIGGAVATNTIETSAITSFSPFTISSDLNFAALPIELISFKANCAGDKQVDVKWSTASEHNTSHFVVEKSRDGLNWTTLNTLGAAGNSTTVIEYTLTDNNDAIGTTYYRLTQFDTDGASETFNVASVNCGAQLEITSNLVTYPNPSNGSFYVDFYTQDITGPSLISVVDSRGVIIYRQDVLVEKGSNVFHIEKMEAAPGMYYIKVTNGTTASYIVKHSLR